MALLIVSGISKTENGNLVVNDISFTQQVLQKTAIAGATGSGKTTLLKMIAGLVQPDAGEIRFETKKVIGPSDQLMPGHPGIAYLSQYFELRNNYRVYEMLEMVNQLSEAEANTIYTICQVDHLLKRRTDELSGGERQRIALAGLLTTAPKLLLLDEPFSNLDMIHKNVIKSVIQDIGEKLKITCILVSHDAGDILSWADRILILKDGAIIQDDTPEQVYYRPINEYAAGLLGIYSLIDHQLASILGIELQGKRAIIRPEQFTIVSAGNHQFSGMVQRKLFWGSYYIMNVLTNNQTITVKTSCNAFKVGDTIYLTISTNKA